MPARSNENQGLRTNFFDRGGRRRPLTDITNVIQNFSSVGLVDVVEDNDFLERERRMFAHLAELVRLAELRARRRRARQVPVVIDLTGD